MLKYTIVFVCVYVHKMSSILNRLNIPLNSVVTACLLDSIVPSITDPE